MAASNAALFLLSGLIEWRDQHLDTARTEFEEALKIDFGQCEAATYLGSVHVQRGDPTAAMSAYTQARQCYSLAIAVRAEYIAKINAGPESPATKARMAGAQQRALDDATRQRDETDRLIAQLQRASAGVTR